MKTSITCTGYEFCIAIAQNPNFGTNITLSKIQNLKPYLKQDRDKRVKQKHSQSISKKWKGLKQKMISKQCDIELLIQKNSNKRNNAKLLYVLPKKKIQPKAVLPFQTQKIKYKSLLPFHSSHQKLSFKVLTDSFVMLQTVLFIDKFQLILVWLLNLINNLRNYIMDQATGWEEKERNSQPPLTNESIVAPCAQVCFYRHH